MPVAAGVMPAEVAVWSLDEAQAQSILPAEVPESAALDTAGVSVRVLLVPNCEIAVEL